MSTTSPKDPSAQKQGSPSSPHDPSSKDSTDDPTHNTSDLSTSEESQTPNGPESRSQLRYMLMLLALFGLSLGLGLWLRPPAPPSPPPSSPLPSTPPSAERDTGPVEVEVTDGAFNALPQDTLAGLVLGHDGTPLPGATVSVRPRDSLGAPPETTQEVITDARGMFTLGPLPAVEYRLEASAPGHARRVVGRIVPAPTPIELQLSRGGGRRGMVANPQGHGLDGAEIRVGGAGFWPPVVVTADASGQFELPPLPEGAYEILARWRGPGLSSWGVRTTFEHGGQGGRGPLRLELEPTPTVTLRVIDATTGLGLPGALVTLAEDVVHVLGVSAWTDLDGELMLYGIPEGDVQLQVKAGGYLEVRRPLTLVLKALREADGLEDDVLDIPMDPAGSLQGMVVDTAGNPVGLAQVVGHVVTDTGAQWLMQRDTTGGIDPLVMPDSDEEAPPSFAGMFGFFSDAEGYVEVTGLPAGTVVLEVRRQGYQPTWAGPFRLGPGGTL
ncbi:MAG: carboxypeptidase regulatory-like domain-containing protein, partial [Myxococcota bacterium]